LSREYDGSVKLHLDRLVAEPKWLVVSLEKNGRIIFGRSSLPQQQPSDAPLELRVREARNTILSQELWHEMVREGHSLSGYNVHCSPSSVTYRMDDTTTISFTLAALGDAQELAGDPEARSGDAYANTISSALYLLLSYAHRQNAHQRGQVQPLSTSQANLPKPTYYLLRPLIAYLQHEIWVRSSQQFVSDLVAVLRFAGIDAAQYTFEELPLASLVADGASEQFLARLIGQFSFRLIITLTPEVRIEMMGTSKCAPRPNWGIRFTPVPPPPTQDVPSELVKNPLNEIFPPADNYEQIRWAFEYLLGATTRCLAKHFELRAAEWTAKAPQGGKPRTAWAKTLKGAGVRDRDTGRRGVMFEMLRADNDRTEDRSTATTAKGESCVWPAPPTLPAVAGLKMVGDLFDSNGHIVRQEWTWTLDDIRKGASAQKEGIEDVVQRVLVQAA
jgi:mediator of RNA polymerase II transcription subunit 17